MTEGAGPAWAASRRCSPPAIVHSMHHQIGSSGMRAFEMAGGLLYLAFLKSFLPDLFIPLPTLILGYSPSLIKSERGTQIFGSPYYRTVS